MKTNKYIILLSGIATAFFMSSCSTPCPCGCGKKLEKKAPCSQSH